MVLTARLGGGPIKAALKHLSCPAVTPGAMGVLSASFASVLFRRTSAALSSSFLHVAINAGRNGLLSMKSDAQWRSNYSRYGRKGHTESKIHPSTRQVVRFNGTNGAAVKGGEWPNQGCSKAPQLSRCYTCLLYTSDAADD